MKRELWLWVVNRGHEVFRDRFDGEDYIFEPGEPLEIPAAAAKLIFGWGEENKGRCLQRLGWARTNLDLEAGLKRLNQFTFHTERPPLAPVGGKAAAGTDEEPAAVGSPAVRTKLGLGGGRTAPA